MYITKKMLLQLGFYKVTTAVQNVSIVAKQFNGIHPMVVIFVSGSFSGEDEKKLKSKINYHLMSYNNNITLDTFLSKLSDVQFDNGLTYKEEIEAYSLYTI